MIPEFQSSPSWRFPQLSLVSVAKLGFLSARRVVFQQIRGLLEMGPAELSLSAVDFGRVQKGEQRRVHR